VGRATDRERGAALVEFAIIAPLLLLLLFGIIEFGFLFRHRLTVANATQTSGRVGAALGTNEQADYEILQALAQGLSTLTNSGTDNIKYVAIFEADANGDPVGACAFPGGGTSCNVYAYQKDFWTSPPCDWNPCPFEPATGAGTLGGGWGDDFGGGSPPERDTELPGLGVLGVRVYYSYQWITGGFLPVPTRDCASPPSGCFSDIALFQLEPEQFGLAGP
jgi:hypothetical protein